MIPAAVLMARHTLTMLGDTSLQLCQGLSSQPTTVPWPENTSKNETRYHDLACMQKRLRDSRPVLRTLARPRHILRHRDIRQHSGDEKRIASILADALRSRNRIALQPTLCGSTFRLVKCLSCQANHLI